ncbi:MAG: glycosyltransferase family 2 protein [Elainella sp. C42_A2020_010]|nr:glycosyltransferase family 2 protein [Elainella sp. C42_A2020_010]RNJ67793.1 MAG: glycosyltransferase family 2 protein [Leptolyngbya sp. IPPAS B-1204]
MMDFTVAIPTYNGEQRLPDVLRRLQTQTGLEAVNWEVLVVDNNSQDQTAAIVEAFQTTFSCPLRYCVERQQGASYARQRAVREAHSELIGFLDDDNLPDPGWVLAAYQFAQQHPQAGAYGSRITGEFEVEPPAHFQRIAPFMAIVERGSQPHRYEPEKKLLPPSAGLVVRKQAWLAHVPEQTLLNRLHFKRSDGNDCSEDIEALSYIQQSGWEVWHNPAMRIAHKIPAWRLERGYLLPLFRSIGLSRCATRLVSMKPHQRWWMTAAYMVSDLRRVVLHMLKYRAQFKTDLVAACELELYFGILISPFYLLAQHLSKEID